MGIRERKQKEKKARINSIKKSAGFLFQKNGFESTKMEDIADRAEISKATIYQYFKSKNDLFYEMMQERLTFLNKGLMEIYSRHEDPETTLRLITNRTFEFAIEDSEIFNLITRFKTADIKKLLSPDKARHLKEIMASNLKQLELTIKEGIERGIFRKMDAQVGAAILWSTFIGIIHYQENRSDVGKMDYKKSTLDAASDLIISGLKKK